MISSQFITYKRDKVGCQHLQSYKIIFFSFSKKGHLMQENMWLGNQEKSARKLLIIMLAILDQMRTSSFAWMLCNCIPTCVIFRVLRLYNELYIYIYLGTCIYG